MYIIIRSIIPINHCVSVYRIIDCLFIDENFLFLATDKAPRHSV